MNNMIVKNVDFFGDELLATQDENGVVWAGIRWLCDGIGLSKGQMQSERKKIQEDVVLSKGERNFILPTNGGNQDVLCLRLDYVPLWLAKISITPKIKKEKPEVAEKLITYQLQAKDVLAEAFLPIGDNGSPTPQGIPMRFYKNNKWYILIIGDEVYSLKPGEAVVIDKAVSAMLKNGVAQIDSVVRTIIDGFGRDCRLECAKKCTVGINAMPLEDKSRGEDGAGE